MVKESTEASQGQSRRENSANPMLLGSPCFRLNTEISPPPYFHQARLVRASGASLWRGACSLGGEASPRRLFERLVGWGAVVYREPPVSTGEGVGRGRGEGGV